MRTNIDGNPAVEDATTDVACVLPADTVSTHGIHTAGVLSSLEELLSGAADSEK